MAFLGNEILADEVVLGVSRQAHPGPWVGLGQMAGVLEEKGTEQRVTVHSPWSQELQRQAGLCAVSRESAA